MSPPTHTFVQVKSYGDLTIAAAGLRTVRHEGLESLGLLISPHLRELAAALAPGCRVETIPLAEQAKPAFFDPHEHHVLDRLRSVVALRRAIARAAKGSTLVMPHLGWRNRLIIGRRAAVALPRADNIYVAYDAFLRGIVGDRGPAPPCRSPRSRRVAICPFARGGYKNIPPDLVVGLFEACAGAGLDAEVLLLEGEQNKRADLVPSRVIPRRFAALGDALASYGAVVSADSLPAHLAEYRGTPVFVVSPLPNSYWLPPTALGHHAWGVFAARDELMARLRRFLRRELPG